MSMLSQVQSGVIAQRPLRVLIYGVPGVGKSTFAAQAPAPVFLDAEQGTKGLDVNRIPITKFWQLSQALQELENDKHEFRTVVLDTLDALERLLVAEICRDANVASIAEVGGGFGKGWERVEQQWDQIQQQLARLQDRRGMNVIVCAHAAASSHNDPAGDSYQRWSLRCNKRTREPWMGWSEEVLFATFAVKATRGKAKGNGRRVIETGWRAGLDAKNRRNLPQQMALDWKPFAEALRRGVKSSRRATQAAQAELEQQEEKQAAPETVSGGQASEPGGPSVPPPTTEAPSARTPAAAPAGEGVVL